MPFWKSVLPFGKIVNSKAEEGRVMQLDENALLVLRERYLLKDEAGNLLETPDELFRRVASAISRGEDNDPEGRREEMNEAFYQMMANLEFLPNSPTLMNAGRPSGQLAACFVLPVEDSLDSIFESVKLTAKIHQTGGGTGFSFSRLRPKNDFVQSSRGVASGPVSFIRVFNCATEAVKQGGARRGANMGILRIDHPDIEEFVSVKRDPAELTNFNLSVAFTDDFMHAYEEDGEFPLINPRTKEAARTVKARKLLRLIAESAWASGEPGAIFLDAINRANPTPSLGEIEATNPCGEQPLLPYESCCLGSINLSRLVKDGEINWARLSELTHLGVRFLDNVIDVGTYPSGEIRDKTRGNRKVGLGIMGFAHVLIRLGIPYDSPDAARIGDKVMRFIERESKIASNRLAKKRGPFPNFRGSVWDGKNLLQRNATTTTIAPTGTLSLLAGTSSGIEPIFDIRYKRILLGGIEVEVEDPLWREIKDRADAEEKRRQLFRKAYEVPPLVHLNIQRTFQNSVDNAVSKTVNLPETATVDDILQIYLEAHRMGLKGMTVFRNKSRNYQILSCGTQQIC
ncbi:ribonucleoside-diphosphate reductase class II [Syntrophus gentianae]|uniref:Vitamin B12-dependent ribonucleotide reductase n=1 Tax=Syntrophus gentianae TaxID=43775 RepID=A0A1H7ZM05_9BACT|nr:adenosylcobalamin-dependent ribonucleoside-diphosphate reductase [Syntrophus gentianae]SEM59355.1 ribonucleoside-diphosphate reductase class II [Syntrophus gentianae]